jgi:RNA polymerase-associated protein CTR9
MQLFNEMSMSMFDIQGYITRCFAFLINGQIKQAAKTLCDEGTVSQATEPLVLIAQAIIHFNEGKLPQALEYLQKVVQINPLCPGDIWLAIGICHFKLNNFIKAKFAFEYVLEKDPENSMALTSLGITEIRLNEQMPSQREKAIVLFQKSFQIDNTNPLTMKYLANHFFFKNEL